MSFNRFDSPTMIAVSGPWVDEAKEKPLLESMPLTAGLVPVLVATHNRLLFLQMTPSAKNSAIRKLVERAGLLDGAHDDKYRSLYTVLSGWASVTEGARKAEIEEVLKTLLPDGLAGTLRTYLAESGGVDIAASKMNPKIESVLKSIVVDGKSAFDLFQEWTAVGRELGDVERERIRLEKIPEEGAISAGDILRAKFKWIRAVNALIALLDLDDDIPQETRIRLLEPLRNAEAKFAKKASQEKDPTEGVDPTEETETEETETDKAAPSMSKTNP